MSLIPIEPDSSVLDRLKYYTIDTLCGTVKDPSGKEMGSLNDRGYHMINIRVGQEGRVHFKRAHIIWWAHHGVWPKQELDHENRDNADDRIANLRESNRHEQNTNKSIVRKVKLPTGVSQHRFSNRFQTKITIKGITTHLGTYDTAEEASKAYQKALEESRGRL